MATNKLRIGDVTPSKLYMGDTEVTKVYMGETLVYEKSTSSSETWLLNEIPQWIGISSRDFSIQFTSNNQSFTLFRFNRSGINQYDLQYNDVVVNGGTWNNSLNRPNWTGWTNETYRTITFATPPTGDLLTWLQANGTKQ